MDRAVIASMKGYAAENNSSISQIVETFFKGLLSSQTGKKKISPLVQELSGIIPAEDNEHNDYVDYLEKNMSKLIFVDSDVILDVLEKESRFIHILLRYLHWVMKRK